MGIVVFTPFVFVDSTDTVFMIINQGNWSFIFNTVTRTLYVFWSIGLLAIGLNVIHKMSVRSHTLMKFLRARRRHKK